MTTTIPLLSVFFFSFSHFVKELLHSLTLSFSWCYFDGYKKSSSRPTVPDVAPYQLWISFVTSERLKGLFLYFFCVCVCVCVYWDHHFFSLGNCIDWLRSSALREMNPLRRGNAPFIWPFSLITKKSVCLSASSLPIISIVIDEFPLHSFLSF